MSIIANWQQRARTLKNEVKALYLAYRDPRTPWYAKVFMAAVLGYAVSPIDLIPDFIPVLGYLDDLIIVPAGIFVAIKMIPPGVMQECRKNAVATPFSSRAKWVIAGAIIAIWIVAILLLARLVWQVILHR